MTPADSSAPVDDPQRLADQYQEIARLAGGLAHEIRNPLSTIRLNMELLAEEFDDPESARDRRVQHRIGMVQQQCDRLQGLLDDFLQYSRVQQAAFQPADLNAEVLQACDFFRPKLTAAGVELFTYLQTDLPSVRLDRESFQGALLNLMLNALQAMPDGGQLVMGTETTTRGVALHLIDTGCGMDMKTMARIFDTFYTTKPNGSGLGLPTTKKIIEAHGGSIYVQSDVGRGTRFTIELPTPPRLDSAPPRTSANEVVQGD